MANVLTVPNSGIISFDTRAFSDLSVPPLSTSARISYGNAGDINITSYTTAATVLDRFTVDGTQGRLFSVTDSLTGTLFSVNNITGLPILEVKDTNTVIAGKFNSNALVVSGTQVSVGNTPFDTSKLGVSGNVTVVGDISATGSASISSLSISVPTRNTNIITLRDQTGNANATFYFTNPIGSPPDLNINAGRVIFPNYGIRVNRIEGTGGQSIDLTSNSLSLVPYGNFYLAAGSSGQASYLRFGKITSYISNAFDSSLYAALVLQGSKRFAAWQLEDGTIKGTIENDGTITTSDHGNSSQWNSTYTTVRSNSASWVNSKTIAQFTAIDNQPPATNFATLDTRNSIAVLDFDDTNDESAVFVGVMPEGASLGSGLKIRLHWMATSATSGDCVWDVSLERMTTDLDSDSFDTIASATAAANGTSGILTVTEITLTAIDSVTAGDGFRLKVTRDANNASDTMTGDAELVVVEVRSAA